MLRARKAQLLVLVVIGSLLLGSLPAWAGQTSSGQWNFTRGGVTCTFAGIHSRSNGFAYAQTSDANALCASLKVRLKHKRTSDGVIVTNAWSNWSAVTDGVITQIATVSSTAVSSQHQAQNNFDLAPSPIEQPHAF